MSSVCNELAAAFRDATDMHAAADILVRYAESLMRKQEMISDAMRPDLHGTWRDRALAVAIEDIAFPDDGSTAPKDQAAIDRERFILKAILLADKKLEIQPDWT